MFFDDHPEFLETSNTATVKDRLNLRHVSIIEENADVLGDGRFSTSPATTDDGPSPPWTRGRAACWGSRAGPA